MSEASQTATHAGGARRRVTGGRGTQLDMFSRAPLLLSTEHYLGPIGGKVYEDAAGVAVREAFRFRSWGLR